MGSWNYGALFGYGLAAIVFNPFWTWWTVFGVVCIVSAFLLDYRDEIKRFARARRAGE